MRGVVKAIHAVGRPSEHAPVPDLTHRRRPIGRGPVTTAGPPPPSQAGSVLVEMAFVLPVLVTLVFGVIDFGNVFNNMQAVRHGVRQGARAGAAATNFGTAPTCTPAGLTGSPSPDVQEIMCMTKDAIGLGGTSSARVKVLFATPDLTAEVPSGGYTTGNALIVCAEAPISSLTGLFAPFLNGKFMKSKASIRIENNQPTGDMQTEADGAEAPPSGGDWSWCTTSSQSP